MRRSSSSSVNVPQKNSSLSGFMNDGSSKPKKTSSASVGGELNRTPLSGFLKDGSSKSKLKGSSSVSGEKKSSLSGLLNGSKSKKKGGSASVSGEKKTSSLSGFLNDGTSPKLRKGGSASVAGDRIAVSKESSLTGEVYVRADGKKVRRVKKSALTDDPNVEIITRPDGTKVRRIRKTKAKPASGTANPSTPTSTADSSSGASSDPPKKKLTRSLSGFFTDKSSKKKQFSGSNSIAGDQYAENEIYIRADGKKVRRVRKNNDDSKSLGGFLDSDAGSKPKLNGAATVTGDTRGSESNKPEEEIYVRPDGKVRSFVIQY